MIRATRWAIHGDALRCAGLRARAPEPRAAHDRRGRGASTESRGAVACVRIRPRAPPALTARPAARSRAIVLASRVTVPSSAIRTIPAPDRRDLRPVRGLLPLRVHAPRRLTSADVLHAARAVRSWRAAVRSCPGAPRQAGGHESRSPAHDDRAIRGQRPVKVMLPPVQFDSATRYCLKVLVPHRAPDQPRDLRRSRPAGRSSPRPPARDRRGCARARRLVGSGP